VTDRLRLAELVAALSLGIDLGFGQPMEHVLASMLDRIPSMPWPSPTSFRHGTRDDRLQPA
jgi:hypothetical protein